MHTVYSFWYPHTRGSVKRPTLNHFKQHWTIGRAYANAPVKGWELEDTVLIPMWDLRGAIKAVSGLVTRSNVEGS